jgi:uncharacterized coiled-coil DUF342 family protein
MENLDILTQKVERAVHWIRQLQEEKSGIVNHRDELQARVEELQTLIHSKDEEIHHLREQVGQTDRVMNEVSEKVNFMMNSLDQIVDEAFQEVGEMHHA